MRAFCAALTLAFWPFVAPAQEGDPIEGKEIFQDFCAVCHGVAAGGGGPMAQALRTTPPDLTALAEGNGGTFPAGRVVRRIDGREPLLSHGGEMPLFGRYFEGPERVPLKAETGQPILTSQPIADLVAWLETVQR
ncbi:MAG: cytochrome c [Rhodobacteraceae bacterium]|nr:cytochrome c [Paracoccaceae bacterium]